jgi:tetratricopeptide (TPR) repeat protein
MSNPDLPTTNDPGTSAVPSEPAPAASAEPTPAADAASTAIQAKGPAAASPDTRVIADAPPAPPPDQKKPRRSWSPEQLAARVGRLDRVLVGLVLVLAFALGCYAILNTDFWMHLATGRLISSGEYSFGTDPFSYASEGVTWVNHSWLFDWLLYNLYRLVGEPGLVVFRGLLMAALAGLMLRFRQAGQPLAIPAVCAGLAVVVLSSRLAYTSALASYLLLGLTLYLLHRGVEEGATFSWRRGARPVSVLWLLPPLFALWVNLDGWFLLGPLTVALYLLGMVVQRMVEGRSEQGGMPDQEVPSPESAIPNPQSALGTLGLVLLAGLAACLLNPYLQRAFTLPPELAYMLADVLPEGMVSAGLSARTAASQMASLYPNLSPLSSVYWDNNYLGRNVAGLAYFPLLLLGMVSFVLLVRRQRGRAGRSRRFPLGRLLVWLFMAILGALHLRAVAFFAVVAGPITALNLQQYLARPATAETVVRRPSDLVLLGRVGALLGCVVLLLLAWPGWLHGSPDDPRRTHRVSWHAYAEPSLVKAARRLDDLLKTEKLQHGFNYGPEAANYFAWFAGPSARTFFDLRYTVPPKAAADYARVRKALREEWTVLVNPRKSLPDDRRVREIQRVFRTYRINYIVLTSLHLDPEARDVANRLTIEPRQWVPLYGDGRTAIFGWRDPHRPDNPFAGLEVDRSRLAFGKVPSEQRAPRKGPEPPDGPPPLWEHYLFGKPPPALQTAEAESYLVDYHWLSPRWQRWQVPFVLSEQLSALLEPAEGRPNLPPAYARGAALHLRNVRKAQEGLAKAILANDPGPPELPLLTIRAARRAIEENPADPGAYVTLAEGYFTLWQIQEQRWVPHILPQGSHEHFMSRSTLRHIQYVTAVKLALRFQPDNPFLHLRLARVFQEMNYFDVALEHAELAKAALSGSAARRQSEKDQERQVKELDKLVKWLGDEVRRRRDEYDLQTVGQKSALEKFRTALLRPTRPPWKIDPANPPPRGLAKLGLELLREVDPDTLSAQQQPEVADWQIKLMLLLGMSKDLRETVFNAEDAPRLRKLLKDRYDIAAALFAAAVGNYAELDHGLAEWEKPNRRPGMEKLLAVIEKQIKQFKDAHILALVSSVPFVPTLDPKPAPQLLYVTISQGELMKRSFFVESFIQRVAELRAIRGLLALEQGDTARAREHFENCLELAGTHVPFPSQGLVLRYLALMKPYRGQGGAAR